MTSHEGVLLAKFPGQSELPLEGVEDRQSDTPVQLSPWGVLHARIRQLAIAANTPLCAIASRKIPPRAPFSFVLTRKPTGKSLGQNGAAVSAIRAESDAEVLEPSATRFPRSIAVGAPNSENGPRQ
jgi:hypothetical protein